MTWQPADLIATQQYPEYYWMRKNHCTHEQFIYFCIQGIRLQTTSAKSHEILNLLEECLKTYSVAAIIRTNSDSQFFYTQTYSSTTLSHLSCAIVKYYAKFEVYQELAPKISFDQFIDKFHVRKAYALHDNDFLFHCFLIIEKLRNKPRLKNILSLYKPQTPPPYTTNTTNLAKTIYETKNFTLCPILADALMDAGYEDEYTLWLLNNQQNYFSRGAWIIQTLKTS